MRSCACQRRFLRDRLLVVAMFRVAIREEPRLPLQPYLFLFGAVSIFRKLARPLFLLLVRRVDAV